MFELFNLGRDIVEDSNFPYIHLAYKYGLKNYRLISSGEIIIKSKGMQIPEFVKEFINNNSEVIMIANIISGKIVGITLRTIKGQKEFLTWGNNKGNFYGLGQLDENFKYGRPIILVEGILDCDVIKQFYNNTMAVLTSSLTNNQLATLTRLTNNIILLLDNDEAGISGSSRTEKLLKDKCNVKIMKHYPTLKDAGDIMKLDINHSDMYNLVKMYYSNTINILVGGK